MGRQVYHVFFNGPFPAYFSILKIFSYNSEPMLKNVWWSAGIKLWSLE